MKRILTLLLLTLMVALPFPVLAESTPAASSIADTATATPEALLQQWTQLGDQLRLNGNYPFTSLEKGDLGYEVRALQTRLQELGYYQKEIVDQYGSGTYNAMRQFEKANKLKTDGAASVEDQQALFSADAVAAGAKKTSTTSKPASKPAAAATSGAPSN
jgi:peptidoglycan hydrolase-like protein with peptidoglycan-binding domain